jgi:hypothetical protein
MRRGTGVTVEAAGQDYPTLSLAEEKNMSGRPEMLWFPEEDGIRLASARSRPARLKLSDLAVSTLLESIPRLSKPIEELNGGRRGQIACENAV